MGGDCESLPNQQHFDGQTPIYNSTSAWIREYMGSQNQLPSYMYPCHATIATGQDITLSSLAKPPQQLFENDEPHGWFYCLSTFRQAMFPPSNSVMKEHLSVESPATRKKDDHHNAGQQFPQKQFLVFDQTGDQTTMIFSSGVGAPPVHCLSHLKRKQAEASILQQPQDGSFMMGNAGTDTVLLGDFVDISKFEEDPGSDLQSEMREDTEELNALMYSDGDTDNDEDEDEDEVTSTGHSPGTLTIHDKLNGTAEIREEVASSDEEPAKRQKLSDGGNRITPEVDHKIVSHGPHGTFGVDSDTESRCDSAELSISGKIHSLSGKKRVRKDTILETVRTLQSMIPCGNAATPIEVIDEAINFLLSIKLKAKSVGFDSTM